MKFVFLCSRLAGYFHHCITRLAESDVTHEVMIVSPANTAHKPFEFPNHPRIRIIERGAFDVRMQTELLASPPDFLYLAGWRDHDYRRIARRLRQRIPVVMGSDRLWRGDLKQQLMSKALSPLIRRCCTHFWIPGLWHYEYARRLGFARDQILTGLYSACSELFPANPIDPRFSKPRQTKKITFVGVMWEAKGVIDLIAAFKSLERQFPDWSLQLVGLGPLVEKYQGISERIHVLGFRQPDELPEVLCSSDAFCLPSHRDAWAVVIHEAACAGLPIVATTACGASSAFVQDGYNGFRCKAKDVEDLARALKSVMELSDSQRLLFSQRSHELSRQITPDLWVSRILSLV